MLEHLTILADSVFISLILLIMLKNQVHYGAHKGKVYSRGRTSQGVIPPKPELLKLIHKS